ncbi:MAG: RidA family protein [Rhodobacteraceae bacterium]|nr:RidA family protein [Paracoccaceae bacterium]
MAMPIDRKNDRDCNDGRRAPGRMGTLSKRVAILPPALHPPLANYAHASLVEGINRILHVSGQIAIQPDGSVPVGTAAQARLIFQSIDAILDEADMSRNDVAKISAFVTDRDGFAYYMSVRDDWIRDLPVPPASTLMMVSGFTRPEFCVEVEVIACQT